MLHDKRCDGEAAARSSHDRGDDCRTPSSVFYRSFSWGSNRTARRTYYIQMFFVLNCDADQYVAKELYHTQGTRPHLRPHGLGSGLSESSILPRGWTMQTDDFKRLNKANPVTSCCLQQDRGRAAPLYELLFCRRSEKFQGCRLP